MVTRINICFPLRIICKSSLHPGRQSGCSLTEIPADNLKEIKLHSFLVMFGFLWFFSVCILVRWRPYLVCIFFKLGSVFWNFQSVNTFISSGDVYWVKIIFVWNHSRIELSWVWVEVLLGLWQHQPDQLCFSFCCFFIMVISWLKCWLIWLKSDVFCWNFYRRSSQMQSNKLDLLSDIPGHYGEPQEGRLFPFISKMRSEGCWPPAP